MKNIFNKAMIVGLSVGLASFSSTSVAAYKEVQVADGGTISGQVTFAGDDPAPKTYFISKDNDVCGSGERKIDFVKVNDGALTDVVVYLDKVKKGKEFPQLNTQVQQKGCEFLPFLSVMHNTGDYAAVNDDPVLHNIHTYEIIGRAKKTVFNISQPEVGTITKSIKLKRGSAMKVECDAHDFMHSFVFVAKNPYYAVVDNSGHFSIDNVPPGKYTIKAWHGKLKEQKGKVTVSANGTVTFDFDFK
ncbi:MAG: hypothetical protein QGI54_11330 [Gammaproteobacteria bacterium]|nr:hypothetical protein [Gammaproteobacteria bacterium]